MRVQSTGTRPTSGDRTRLFVITISGFVFGLCGFLAVRWMIG
jgi:hypothetical protein